MKKGNLSINSDNIFPVIKKWLYSDHDIFVRELVSNASDAITKLKKLSLIGEYTFDDGYKERIDIQISAENGTIKFSDNGLGLTEDEVVEYITQIAFSGATKFLENYKDKATEDQIIGHFGLGFYSAFMVAKRVSIDTLSYKEGSKAVHWECDGGIEYEIDESDKTTVGTTITLFLNDDSLEFSNEYRVKEVLDKYCSFMPYEIYFSKENAPQEYETIREEDLKDTDKVIEKINVEAKLEEKEEDGVKKMVEVSPARVDIKIVKREYPVNDTKPLFTQSPSACTDDEYKRFYRKVFNDYKEPLFWIHLNMDYPFNMKGILYFPKINSEYDSIEGTIKLYNTQVFVADNVKEVIPEFLLLLKGVIDCPDLPLNVSRSALQNDGFAQKISDYIAKKIADKLSGMCKTDRENYEKYWDDINPFIKYGCLKDEKFCEKMEPYILFRDLDKKLVSFEDFKKISAESQGIDLDKNSENDNKDNDNKDKIIIYYANDEVQQSGYINMFKRDNIPAVILDRNIDTAYITLIEQKNDDISFKRVDSDITDKAKSDEKIENLEELNKKLSELFREELDKKELNVVLENLKDSSISAIMTVSEEGRRFAEMMKAYNMAGNLNSPFGADDETLVLNANNSLVKFLLNDNKNDNTKLVCEQLYDLALLTCKGLTADKMSDFVARSNRIMELIIDK